jgi:tRNA threonylcarbamoyladenosine biosynthesis protein TsaB
MELTKQPALRILALETATRCCSVAVRVGERLAAETTAVSERTHSAHLMTMVRETLKTADVALPAIDGFAVSLGPGSFTGLRIGISTVQGLAFAAGKPCVGVSSLEALALQGLPWPHGICALMDARKGEVYAGFYRERDSRLERLAPEKVAPLTVVLHAIHTPHLFIGDGAVLYRDAIRSSLGELAHFVPPERNLPRAGMVARLAQPPLCAGQAVDPARLIPRYLRQSDAELRLGAAVPDRRASRGYPPPGPADR